MTGKTPRRPLTRKIKNRIIAVLVTLLATAVLVVFLIPMVYGIVTSLKTETQFAKVGAPWWPATEGQYEYEGKSYDIYKVPIDGGIKEMALVIKGREQSQFIDPDTPEAGLIVWDGAWRQLEHVWTFDAQWGNFVKAWNTINFTRLLGNTLMYASITTFGAVLSASLVAYGFARFRIPKKSILFMLMLSTVILPPAITLIPSYFVYLKLGWVGTWLPLIIPAFFAWGTNVFLIRQFIMSIPRGVDEAAMMDGAGPFRIFFSIIIPQSVPALTAVALFHFFFAWNDFFNPLIYLAGHPDKFPITVGLTAFNRLYAQSFNLIQAAALVTVVIPVIIFFFAQRFFMQGIVITGIEK
ncbi:MAG: carbohydrate ABC transporter permease [Bacteroidetes bacterium]|nr:carbohydrate ABC transporter permease [Bacteroidota bacterium]MBE3113833.1 carbohydrate ABC transporter permease [Actinomycetota bacterium]